MRQIHKKQLFFYLLCILLLSCNSEKNTGENHNKNKPSSIHQKANSSQLNISIFLDLSARIIPSKENSNPKERDIEAVQAIIEFFKEDMKKHGAYKANGKLKVLFSPAPEDPEINSIASALQIDLSTMDNSQKKNTFDTIHLQFGTALERIYDQSLQAQKWVGADIWRFFKKDVKDFCILPNHRNILIILTDGYIYHERSKQKIDERYSYLVGPLFQTVGLRKNTQWQSVVEAKNFGLIAPRTDLEELEVLILEICPETNHPEDEDIIEYLLAKWLKEMGIIKFKIHSTALPVNTKSNIKRFLEV